MSSQGDIDFGEEGGTLDRPKSPSVAIVAIVAAVLVVAGGIGAAAYFASRPGVLDVPGDTIARVGGRDDVRERNADYFQILETSYDCVALLDMASFWQGSYSRYPAFSDSRAGRAAEIVSHAADHAYHASETYQVRLRSGFVKIHGMDSKDWRPQFTKQFPERDVIFDEIKVVVRKVSERQIEAVYDHLNKKDSELLARMKKDTDFVDEMLRTGKKYEDYHAEYRENYVRSHAQEMVEEVRTEVKQLKSIDDLRKKVAGEHPNR